MGAFRHVVAPRLPNAWAVCCRRALLAADAAWKSVFVKVGTCAMKNRATSGLCMRGLARACVLLIMSADGALDEFDCFKNEPCWSCILGFAVAAHIMHEVGGS